MSDFEAHPQFKDLGAKIQDALRRAHAHLGDDIDALFDCHITVTMMARAFEMTERNAPDDEIARYFRKQLEKQPAFAAAFARKNAADAAARARAEEAARLAAEEARLLREEEALRVAQHNEQVTFFTQEGSYRRSIEHDAVSGLRELAKHAFANRRAAATRDSVRAEMAILRQEAEPSMRDLIVREEQDEWCVLRDAYRAANDSPMVYVQHIGSLRRQFAEAEEQGDEFSMKLLRSSELSWLKKLAPRLGYDQTVSCSDPPLTFTRLSAATAALQHTPDDFTLLSIAFGCHRRKLPSAGRRGLAASAGYARAFAVSDDAQMRELRNVSALAEKITQHRNAVHQEEVLEAWLHLARMGNVHDTVRHHSRGLRPNPSRNPMADCLKQRWPDDNGSEVMSGFECYMRAFAQSCHEQRQGTPRFDILLELIEQAIGPDGIQMSEWRMKPLFWLTMGVEQGGTYQMTVCWLLLFLLLHAWECDEVRLRTLMLVVRLKSHDPSFFDTVVNGQHTIVRAFGNTSTPESHSTRQSSLLALPIKTGNFASDGDETRVAAVIACDNAELVVYAVRGIDRGTIFAAPDVLVIAQAVLGGYQCPPVDSLPENVASALMQFSSFVGDGSDVPTAGQLLETALSMGAAQGSGKHVDPFAVGEASDVDVRPLNQTQRELACTLLYLDAVGTKGSKPRRVVAQGSPLEPDQLYELGGAVLRQRLAAMSPAVALKHAEQRNKLSFDEMEARMKIIQTKLPAAQEKLHEIAIALRRMFDRHVAEQHRVYNAMLSGRPAVEQAADKGYEGCIEHYRAVTIPYNAAVRESFKPRFAHLIELAGTSAHRYETFALGQHGLVVSEAIARRQEVLDAAIGMEDLRQQWVALNIWIRGMIARRKAHYEEAAGAKGMFFRAGIDGVVLRPAIVTRWPGFHQDAADFGSRTTELYAIAGRLVAMWRRHMQERYDLLRTAMTGGEHRVPFSEEEQGFAAILRYYRMVAEEYNAEIVRKFRPRFDALEAQETSARESIERAYEMEIENVIRPQFNEETKRVKVMLRMFDAFGKDDTGLEFLVNEMNRDVLVTMAARIPPIVRRALITPDWTAVATRLENPVLKQVAPGRRVRQHLFAIKYKHKPTGKETGDIAGVLGLPTHGLLGRHIAEPRHAPAWMRVLDADHDAIADVLARQGVWTALHAAGTTGAAQRWRSNKLSIAIAGSLAESWFKWPEPVSVAGLEATEVTKSREVKVTSAEGVPLTAVSRPIAGESVTVRWSAETPLLVRLMLSESRGWHGVASNKLKASGANANSATTYAVTFTHEPTGITTRRPLAAIGLNSTTHESAIYSADEEGLVRALLESEAWTMATDENGFEYYYCAATGQSVWDLEAEWHVPVEVTADNSAGGDLASSVSRAFSARFDAADFEAVEEMGVADDEAAGGALTQQMTTNNFGCAGSSYFGSAVFDNAAMAAEEAAFLAELDGAMEADGDGAAAATGGAADDDEAAAAAAEEAAFLAELEAGMEADLAAVSGGAAAEGAAAAAGSADDDSAALRDWWGYRFRLSEDAEKATALAGAVEPMYPANLAPLLRALFRHGWIPIATGDTEPAVTYIDPSRTKRVVDPSPLVGVEDITQLPCNSESDADVAQALVAANVWRPAVDADGYEYHWHGKNRTSTYDVASVWFNEIVASDE